MSSPLPVLPQIIVEAGLVPDQPAQGSSVLRLDDVTFGKLDTATLGTSITWSSISPQVLGFTITRPSTRLQGPLWNYQAGTASILLDNSDGRFDPDNLAGPYVSAGVTQLAAMVPVRVRAVFGGVTYPGYSGFADGWLPGQVTYEGGYAEITLPATDAFKVLAGITLAAVGIEGVAADTGARVSDILSRAGWYTSGERRVITAGNSTLQGTTLGSDALSLMQIAVDSEIGQLYVNGSGAVVFRSRRSLLTDTRSNTVQAVFGDLPGTSHTGLAGVFLNESGMGGTGTDLNAAAALWGSWTGLPVQAVRMYLGASSFSYGTDLAEAVAAGLKVCLTLRPAYNPTSSTDLANMTTLLQTMQANGANAEITLWHEPYFQGLTSAQYIAMVNYYGPTVRAYFPLVFCTAASSVQNNGENSFYPGDGAVDKIATDLYASSWLSSGGSTRLDLAASIADSASPPKPFGLWEFGSTMGTQFLAGAAGTFDGGIANWLGAGNCTASASVSPVRNGTGAMKMTSAAAGDMTAAHCAAASFATLMLACSPGDLISCGAWLQAATAARNVQVGAHFYTSGGALIAGSPFGPAVTDSTSGWTFASGVELTAPATAAWCRLAVTVSATGGAAEIHSVEDAYLTNTTASGQTQAQVAQFFSYVQSFFLARAAGRKLNADLLYFNSGAPATSITSLAASAADYRIPLYRALYAALSAYTELAYAAVGRASDDTTIANDVQATITGSSNLQEAKDTASIQKYLFPRTYARSDLILQGDPDALNWAQWVLYISKGGEDRFESLQIDPQADPVNLWPQVLGREIGDRIQIWQRPASVASPVTKDCFIAGITHTWDSVASAWLTTWTLQDASKYGSFLTLDNPTLGRLDFNALTF